MSGDEVLGLMLSRSGDPPDGWTSKWRWQPGAFPRSPTWPIRWPAVTVSPMCVDAAHVCVPDGEPAAPGADLDEPSFGPDLVGANDHRAGGGREDGGAAGDGEVGAGRGQCAQWLPEPPQLLWFT